MRSLCPFSFFFSGKAKCPYFHLGRQGWEQWCQQRECAAIPVKGAVYLLAHEVHVEARKPCPWTNLMHTHVWAETFKEPPIPGIKTIKKNFFLKKRKIGKHSEPKWRKNSKWEKYLTPKIITAESSLQLAEWDFPSCRHQQKLNPLALSSINCSEARSLLWQVPMCPSAPAVTDISGFAPAEAGAPRGLS